MLMAMARWRRRDRASGPKLSARYVYVIARTDRRGRPVGPTKIGITKDPRQRLRTLQTANPRPLVLCKTFRVLRAAELEREVHRRLSRFRMKGEWFALSPEQAVTAIHRVIKRPQPGLFPARYRFRGRFGDR